MKRKLNIKKIVLAVVLVLVIISLIIGMVKFIGYLNSDFYKLKKVGYNEKEIGIILKYANDTELVKIKTDKYNKYLKIFISQKYFIYNKLDRYIKLYQKDGTVKQKKIVSLVNVSADQSFYENPKKSNTSLKELMLVNKFNYLDSTYKPENIVPIAVQYSYDDNQTLDYVYEKYKEMWQAASAENLKLIVSSSYRDYDYQEELYNNYKNQKGTEWADGIAARAGYSEHQTGYALDIVNINSTMNDFEDSKEFKWLTKNAYKYGFILRYPYDKEDITGYNYESWHYRYVGKEVAKYIYQNNITFDEYYAYFIINKQDK
ncbi:MAG: M15 family metallopeptidase [Bacilli bacterium]